MVRALVLAGGLVLLPALASAREPCTTADARHVVHLIYSHVLERPADGGGNMHVLRLINGNATVREVVVAVLRSSEHHQRFVAGATPESAVRAFYAHILGRAPDAVELEAHVEAMRAHGPAVLIDSLVSSSEYHETYGAAGVPGFPDVRYCPERATGATGNMRFREMDLDRDDVITATEWRGTRQSFRTHDWNGDGLLSGDEVRPHARRPAAAIEDRDFDPDETSFSAWSEAGFDSIDHNRDGRITDREWHYRYETFNRVDRNRDGALSRDEFLAPDDDDRDDSFEFLDADGDGYVERREWHGSATAFAALDRDGDRALSRSEVIGTPRAVGDRFASLDMNRDGRLSADEWHWSRRSFIDRDANRDGMITRRELNGGAVGTTGR